MAVDSVARGAPGLTGSLEGRRGEDCWGTRRGAHGGRTSSTGHTCDRARNKVAERTSTNGAVDATTSCYTVGGVGVKLLQPKRTLGLTNVSQAQHHTG